MPSPPVDYTSKDYAGFRQMLLDVKRERLPEWTSESPSDFGVMLIELFSYVGDVLSYYGDRAANEAFLTTATQRSSVLAIARMLDYRPTGNIAAGSSLTFTVSSGANVTIPAGTRVQTSSLAASEVGADPVVFETDAALTIDGSVDVTGSVAATEGETIADELVGTSDGTVDQVFTLFQYPVVHDSVTVSVDEGSGPVEWNEIDHMIDATSLDTVFTTEVDENEVVTVQFGDDVNGRIPAQGASVTATYRVGGGLRGNVGPNTLIELQTPITDVVDVRNALAATGGADAESNAQIRVNAPKSLTTLERAVTLEDYANLSLHVGGVAKAAAVNPSGNNVTIHIAPFGGGAASTEKKDEVEAYLEPRKMINHTVTLDDPTYIDIDVDIDLQVKPNYGATTTERAVQRAIGELLDFDNTRFGQRVTLSGIYDAVMGVPGVEYAAVTLLDINPGTGVGDAVAAATEIPQLGTLNVTTSGGIVGS